MTTQEDRDEIISNIQSISQELADVDVAQLGRRNKLSESINFEPAIPTLEIIFDYIQPIFTADLSGISEPYLKSIYETFHRLRAFVNEINAFDLKGGNPSGECEDIIRAIKNYHENVIVNLAFPLVIIASQSSEREKEIQKAREARLEAENTVSEIETVLKKVQVLSATAGVSANAKVFTEVSTSHRYFTFAWFFATVVVFGCTIYLAYINYLSIGKYKPESTGEAIHYISAKLILLSIMMFALAWCAKNHRSHRHNQTLNGHRANALRTFETFYNGSSDVEVKDTILLQAANAAFANRSTGYESAPESDNQSTTQFIDIIGKSVKSSQQGPS